VLPIFIPSSGRSEEAQLNFAAKHALGVYARRTPLIIVIRPSDLARYQTRWPQLLFAVLPLDCEKAGAGYARWAIQLATSWGQLASRDGSGLMDWRFSKVWQIDDGITCFCKATQMGEDELAGANAQNTGACRVTRGRNALVDNAFAEALLDCQRRVSRTAAGIAGFLRDDGTFTTKTRRDSHNSLSIYKVILLDNSILNSYKVLLSAGGEMEQFYVYSHIHFFLVGTIRIHKCIW
jgi:hypothetical protein